MAVQSKSIFDNRETTPDDVWMQIGRMLSRYDFTDEDLAFLGGLMRAITGRGAYHRFKLEKAPSGRKFPLYEKQLDGALHVEIANFIDCEMADNEKIIQEGLIAEVSEKYGMDRRSVFNALKIVRNERHQRHLQIIEYLAENEMQNIEFDAEHYHLSLAPFCPWGYRVRDSGQANHKDNGKLEKSEF